MFKSPTTVKVEANKQYDNLLPLILDSVKRLNTLEINTIIAKNITGLTFNPENSYETMYKILERTYPSDVFWHTKSESDAAKNYQKYALAVRYSLNKFKNRKQPNETVPDERLPKKDSALVIAAFDDLQFLQSLRKNSELRAAIDSTNNADPKITDLIVAQTTITLAGDVINRFHDEILHYPKEKTALILLSHREGTAAAQSQWISLLSFVSDFLSKIVSGRISVEGNVLPRS